MEDYSVPLEVLLRKLDVEDVAWGLTELQVAERLHREGENVWEQKVATPRCTRCLNQLKGAFSVLLWSGAILYLFAYILTDDPKNLTLSLIIAGIALLSAAISLYQDSTLRSITDPFSHLDVAKCSVLRDGLPYTVPEKTLVRGDIVQLKAGDRIPADLRIIQSDGMKVNSLVITGESELLLRDTEPSYSDHLYEAKNSAIAGTICAEGTGTGIVISVGKNVFIGRIAQPVTVEEIRETVLGRELRHFVNVMLAVIGLAGAAFFVLGWSAGLPVQECVTAAAGIMAANVPAGVMAAVRAGRVHTVKRMARLNAQVKKLEMIETFGLVTCLVADKTGTLTQNSMAVGHLWYDARLMNAKLLGEAPVVDYNTSAASFQMLQRCAVLCNNANFDNPASTGALGEKQQYLQELRAQPISQRPTTGNASEGGLIRFFHVITPIEETRASQDFLHHREQKVVVPFTSYLKFQASVHRPAPWQHDPHKTDYLLLVRGAPEKLVGLSASRLFNGIELPIDDEWNAAFDQTCKELGENAERVLGFAYRYLSSAKYGSDFEWETSPPNFPIDDLIFIGLISLQDPPRPGAPEAVLACKQAGIKVVMITGDQPITALSIARQCNIVTGTTATELAEKQKLSDFEDVLDECDAVVINGNMLDNALSEDERLPLSERGQRLNRWLNKEEVVFARVSPLQKVQIVESLQQLGHIVAVVGDGPNDGPAIKKADIGIALNKAGTTIAKEAADVLLLDDNIGCIVSGVEEGRLLFENIKKSVVYTLAANMPEVGALLGFFVLQVPLPLSIVLMLVLDLCTSVLPAVTLAYEEAELMQRKPRNAQVDNLVSWKVLAYGYAGIGTIELLAGFVTYFTVMRSYGFSLQVLLGLALNSTGAMPSSTDTYNPLDEHKGNSQWDRPEAAGKLVDWASEQHAVYDLRVWFWGSGPWTDCQYDTESAVVAGARMCYSTEALKAAQTAFFLTIVTTQIMNLLYFQVPGQSLRDFHLPNAMSLCSLAIAVLASLAVTYNSALNRCLGTRPLEWMHLFVPAFPFCLAIVLLGEVRKWVNERWGYFGSIQSFINAITG